MILDDEPVKFILALFCANLPSLHGFQAMFEPVILDVLRV